MRYEDASHTGAFQGQGPIANDDTDQMAAGAKSSATGNIITGEGTQTGSAGADSATDAHITAIAGKGGEDSSFSGGKLSVMGEYGKLSVDAEGNYVYQANKGVENVRDRFTYTLADNNGASDTASLIIEIGKTPFAVKADAQQVVVGPDGVVTLPAGVELSDVHVVGRNLVVDMPDGTQMIIIDGAVFVPQLVLGGVEVPATNVAALLIGQEVQPAAGETPPSSGGNFETPVPPLDPGVPLGDLIPPTEYNYHPPEPQPTQQIIDREPTIFIQPDGQPAAVNAVDTVDEKGLPTRNGGEPEGSGEEAAAGANGDPSEATAGTIVIDSPDGIDSLTITDGNGVAHNIVVGLVIQGDYGTLTITGIVGNNYTYSYVLNDNTSGDTTHDDFIVTLTDSDGDVAAATLVIDIIDDVPTARPDTDAIASGEYGPATGNVITDASAGDAGDSDSGRDTVGADNAHISLVTGFNGSSDNSGPFVVNGQYGVLTMQSDGSYSYVRNPGTPGGVSDVFNYTLTDGDGDTSTTTLTITIGDATPHTGENPLVRLDDDALANGNPGGVGDDNPDSQNVSGNLAGGGGDGPITFGVSLSGAPAGFTYASGGAGVVLVQQGGVTVLTVTVNPNGSYTVVQNAPINHAAGGDENNQSFTINYTVTDVDGDVANGALNINVDDDTPIALEAQVTGVVDEEGLAGGNIGGTGDVAGQALSANGNVSSLFASGADTPLTYSLLSDTSGLPALTSGGVAITYSVIGNTLTASAGGNTVFTFTLNATTGAWTFTLSDNLDHPAGLNENDINVALGSIIQATDHDGDSVTALAGGLVITVDDDTPVANNDVDSIVGGNGPATGNVLTGVDSPGGDANATDGVADSVGVDTPGAITGLASNNVPANVDNNPAGGFVVNGQYGTLTLNADGSYSYLRTDGSPGDKADVFTYTLTDADGDSVTATLTINITDSAPIAGTVNATLDDDALANGNPGGTGDQNPDTSNLTGNLPGSGGDGALTFNVALTGAPAGFTYVSGGAGVVLIQQGGVTKVTVTVNSDGSYTIVQNAPIDHAAGGNENDQAFAISYTVTDSDGDSANGTININVDDDTPIATASLLTGTVDEDGVPGGIAGGPDDVAGAATTASGNVSSLFASGADTPLTYQLLNNFAGLPALTSHGVAVTYSVSFNAGVYTLTAEAGAGNTVFTFTLNATTGAYNFTLVDQLDHPTLNNLAGDDTENELAIQLGSIIQATDHDGDTVAANANGLTITVDDDTPTAANDTDAVTSGGTSTTGNVITGAGTTSGASGQDFPGADAPATITQIQGSGGTDSTFSGGFLDVAGTYGTLQMDANGNYTYTRNGGSPGNVQDTFTYTYQDADGDKVTATLTITINDSAPTAGTVNATLDDDALPNGIPGGTGDQNPDTSNLTGNLPGSGGDGALTFGVLLTGAPAGFTYVSGGAGVVLIQQGGVTKITVTVNSNGSYTIVQNAPIDHAAGGNENDQSFTLNYTVTDADSDVANGTININVDDDTPTVSTNAAVQLDDDALAGGIAGGIGDDANATNVSGTLSHAYGADGAGSVAYLATGAPAGFSYALQGNGDLWVMQGAVHVLTLTVNATTGAYTVTQVAPIVHAAGGDENNQSFTISYQVTDHDGDAATGSIVVNVDDDTPTATVVETGQAVSVDESVGIQVDSNDTTSAGVIALFAGVTNTGTDTHLPQYAQNATAVVASTGSSYGADGAGTTAFSLNVSAAGVDSGLNTTDGHDILLYKEGNLIVGRVSGGADDGKAALAISINPTTGVISTVEYLSIQHPNAANPDDSVSIADGAVLAVVTVTDSDGDAATNQVGIGSAIQFQDSGPVMVSAQNINIQNSGDVAHTGAFSFNLGADGANTANDVITNVTGSATVGGVAVQNWTLTPGAENGTTASYSFSFDYPIGGGATAHETGTLVFDKVAGTYTVDLDNPIQGVTTILQTATGTLFQGYEPGTSTVDGSQPAISVTQIQDLAGTANDIYVQFTGVAEPSSGTGDNNLEFSNWVPGGDNPPPVNGGGDTTWNAGQLFNQTDSWVSTSNSANGVAGDTIQGGEVLDFTLVQGANPTGNLAQPGTFAQASSMFLKFDGIGASEDMIVVLKLYDPTTNTYTTRAVMIENADIFKGPGSGPGSYSSISLDNNDGLVIIESNDYNLPGEHYVIVGAQVAGSDEGLSGTAINLNGAIGAAGDSDVNNDGSLDTQSFATDVNDGPFKISSIGFTTISTTPQNAQLDFDVTVTDGDGDSITQHVTATVTTAADSTSAATIPAANTTVAPVVLDLNGDGVQFLAADAGVRYDYNGDGVKEATAWAGPSDGILIHDANGNGTVDGAGEFVFGSGNVTDLQGLRALYGDTLDANDADFSKFGVWQDANSNGVVDAGEYQSLTAAGITSINLVSDGVTYTAANGDVVVAGSSTYANADGSTGSVADASFYTLRQSEDGQALNTSSSNIAVAAAVAAAGLAASQPAAASTPDAADHGQETAAAAASSGVSVAADTSDEADASHSALGNETKEVANDDAPASSGHASASEQSHQSLDDSQASAAANSNGAPASDDQGPATADAHVAAAPAVAMVSADALQAVAELEGGAKHGGAVEKIIAEALGQANGHGQVDALLDAIHGGNGGGQAIANLASQPANGVPAWDMASNGGSTGNYEVLMKVGAEMLHHDMVPPTHNG